MQTPATESQSWSLWAWSDKTSTKTLVARGTPDEMMKVFDRLIVKGDRLQLVDANGAKLRTSCGPLTDYAAPEAVSIAGEGVELPELVLRIDSTARRLNDLDKRTTAQVDTLARDSIKDGKAIEQIQRDALSFASSVGGVQGEIMIRLANLGHDVDKLREASMEIQKAHANQIADLRRDLETLAEQVDKAPAAADPAESPTPEPLQAQVNKLSESLEYLRRDTAQLDRHFRAFQDRTKQTVGELQSGAVINELLAISRAKQVTRFEAQLAASRDEVAKLRKQADQTQAILAKLAIIVAVAPPSFFAGPRANPPQADLANASKL